MIGSSKPSEEELKGQRIEPRVADEGSARAIGASKDLRRPSSSWTRDGPRFHLDRENRDRLVTLRGT